MTDKSHDPDNFDWLDSIINEETDKRVKMKVLKRRIKQAMILIIIGLIRSSMQQLKNVLKKMNGFCTN